MLNYGLESSTLELIKLFCDYGRTYISSDKVYYSLSMFASHAMTRKRYGTVDVDIYKCAKLFIL